MDGSGKMALRKHKAAKIRFWAKSKTTTHWHVFILIAVSCVDPTHDSCAQLVGTQLTSVTFTPNTIPAVDAGATDTTATGDNLNDVSASMAGQ